MKVRGSGVGVSGGLIVVGLLLVLAGCSSGGTGAPPPPPIVAPSVTLTVAKVGNGTVTSSSGINCGASCTLTVSSGTVVTLIAAPQPGHTLTNWGGACVAGSVSCTLTITANQTVTATFSSSSANPALDFTVAGTGTGSVTCNGGPCASTYPWGTSVTLAGVPGINSSFAGWSGGSCTGTATCTIVLWVDTQITATFNLLPVTAQLSVTKNGTGAGTVTSNPAGINCGATCTANFSGGAVVTLTATPASSNVFVGWAGGGCTGTGTCVVTMNANAAVTATFDVVPPTVTLTTATGGTGTGTITCNGGGCNSSYPSGTVLTIAASPAATSLFSGWGGACASAGTSTTCTLTINANSTVSATFNLPTLSVVLAGTGSVTSSPVGINCGATCTTSFNKGTSVTLTATGAGFSGWSGGGCSGAGTCVVTLNQNTSVTATFGTIGGGPVNPVRLSAGLGFTLGIRADGTVISMGLGMTGGSGIVIPGTAAKVVTGLSNISVVMAPFSDAAEPNFAIMTDGSVWGWGIGVLGASVTGAYGVTVDTPILVPAFGQATALSGCSLSGLPIFYALHSDGTVSYTPAISQVAANAIRTSTTQTIPGLASVVSMSEGCFKGVLPQSVIVVVKSDGTVWTVTPVGSVVAGPPPFITTTTFIVNVAQVMGLPPITQVSCGKATARGFCLARATNGSVWAWGDNAAGQLGDGTLNGHLIPFQVPGLTSISRVIAGFLESYAIDASGVVYSWGASGPGGVHAAGTLGILGRPVTNNAWVPGVVTLAGPAVEIASSGTHAAVLLSDGTIWSWGSNIQGEFGDGSSGTTSAVPVQALGINLN